jgi:hypothetical protein
MNKGIIFGPPYDGLEWNKWERPVGDKIDVWWVSKPENDWFVLTSLSASAVRYLGINDGYCDRNSKDDGVEYYIYEEADVDDDDDFYGDIPPMLGDIWIDEDVDHDDSDEFM